MYVISLSNGAQFSSDPGESILDAAARANVAMAYSCRTGRCSSCKCKVLKGDSSALQHESGLGDEEAVQGWILGCVRSATTDMTLEVEDLSGLDLPPVKTLPCRVHTLEKLAPDVIKVVLRLPPSADFRFLPGQYIDVIGPGSARRSYSLANADAKDKLLELHIREVPGGTMSEYWFSKCKVNDLLRLNGPLGVFALRNIEGRDLVFLATGTGIAPVKSMLESLDVLPAESRPRSVAVYWGGRTPADLYWDMNSVAAAHRFTPVLSKGDASWAGARGYVQEALTKEKSDFSHAIVYACGSPSMIRSAREVLVGAGLSEKHFVSDAFVCSATL